MDICVDSGLGLLYKAPKDILIHDFWYHMHAFLGGVYLGLELLGQEVCFSSNRFHRTLPPATYSSFSCITTLPVLGIIIESF